MIPFDTELLTRVGHTVRRQQLFRPDDTVIVAVSGGADSSALLDLLTRLPGYNLQLIACHLNHCLRGEESDADQEFCRCLASHYSIPFEWQRIDVSSMASDLRLNLEDAGRRARIDFFDVLVRKYGAAAVVLAHHADDQAETVLMRLLRGSGTTGLSGMAYRNARGYVRPLLEITRSEIEQYLRHCGLEWREDASNVDTTFLRNRIRHQLLPLLEEYNPAIRVCLASTASIISDDEALLEELTARSFDGLCRVGDGRIDFSVRQLSGLTIALRRRVLRRAFKQVTGTLAGVNRRHIDALCDMISSDRPNTRLALPHAVLVVRAYDRLVWMHPGDTGPDTGFELAIPAPGCYKLPRGGTLSVDSAVPALFPADRNIACFDLARFPFPWLVRTFRHGDRMVPFGMCGRKKVKDIFIDRKIPASERTAIPLLFCGDDLIWIAGLCISESCRIDAPSAATVQVTWKV